MPASTGAEGRFQSTLSSARRKGATAGCIRLVCDGVWYRQRRDLRAARQRFRAAGGDGVRRAADHDAVVVVDNGDFAAMPGAKRADGHAAQTAQRQHGAAARKGFVHDQGPRPPRQHDDVSRRKSARTAIGLASSPTL